MNNNKKHRVMREKKRMMHKIELKNKENQKNKWK